MTVQRIGLFGGSFNPIHIGHLISARSAAERLGLERVILIPAGSPPNKWANELAPARDRLEMVRRAVDGDPVFDVSEVDVQQEGLNYAIHAVVASRAALGPGARLHWIIGGDALGELKTWHRVRDFVDLCEVVTTVRPGYEQPDLAQLAPVLSLAQIEGLRAHIVETQQIEISATDIRQRIRQGRSIRYLVPELVREYIVEEGLYRA